MQSFKDNVLTIDTCTSNSMDNKPAIANNIDECNYNATNSTLEQKSTSINNLQ